MSWLIDKRVLFLLMVVLIIGGLVGANKLMHNQRPLGVNNRDPAANVEKAAANNTQRATGVVAMGTIAPEGNIVFLVPSQKGEVIEVLVKDEQQVKKGQVLLRLDDRLAKFDLARTESGVEQAELLVKKADDGMREWQLRRDIQLKQIEISEGRYKQAYEAAKRLEGPANAKATASAEADYQLALLKGQEALKGIDAERLALDLINHKKPTNEIEQARAGLKDAKILRDKAKLGVDFCELKAPADGTIMRSLVSVGDRFGEQGIRPAFYFYQGGL